MQWRLCSATPFCASSVPGGGWPSLCNTVPSTFTSGLCCCWCWVSAYSLFWPGTDVDAAQQWSKEWILQSTFDFGTLWLGRHRAFARMYQCRLIYFTLVGKLSYGYFWTTLISYIIFFSFACSLWLLDMMLCELLMLLLEAAGCPLFSLHPRLLYSK